MIGRRLVIESRKTGLTLASAGRFSSHSFFLFNDCFVHLQVDVYFQNHICTHTRHVCVNDVDCVRDWGSSLLFVFSCAVND